MDLIEIRRRILTMNDYAPIDYIESSGTQWIDTGLYTSTTVNTEYEAILGYWKPVEGRQLMGANYGAIIGITENAKYDIGNTTRLDAATDTYDIIRFSQDITNKKQRLTINGTTYTRNYTASFKAHPVFLFYMGGSSTSNLYRCRCRMKAFTIIQGGTIARQYLPRIHKPDNKPGLYDTVTKTFFVNSGDGEFIIPT